MVRWFYRVLSLTLVSAVLVIVGAVAAQDQPSGKISLDATSVAAGVGAQWGDGTLTLNNGQQYQFTVKGLEVGGVGFVDIHAEGTVYNLYDLADFNGVYVAAETNASVGSGPGMQTMRNSRGVIINLSSAQQGVKMTFAGQGVRLALK